MLIYNNNVTPFGIFYNVVIYFSIQQALMHYRERERERDNPRWKHPLNPHVATGSG